MKYAALDNVKYAALDNVKMERAVDALDALGDGKIEDANKGAIKPSALDSLDAMDAPDRRLLSLLRLERPYTQTIWCVHSVYVDDSPDSNPVAPRNLLNQV